MQESGGHSKVALRPIRNHSKGMQRADLPDIRGRRKTAPSSPSAFLTTKIESIVPTEEQMSQSLGVALNESRTYLFDSFRNLLECLGDKFEYNPSGESFRQELQHMVEAFEKQIDKYDLRITLVKSQSDDYHGLCPVVYRNIDSLNCYIVVFHASPVDSLSKKGSDLFARFISYTSHSMDIGIGYEESVGNWFLEPLFGQVIDEEIDDEDYTSMYREYIDGDIANTLNALKTLPDETMESLSNDITEYLKDCPNDEYELFSVILEGLPIIGNMNIRDFDFVPDDDGFERIHYSCGSCVVSSTCILYSGSDGVEDELIESVNNEFDSGQDIYGWSLPMKISPETKRDDIVSFIDRVEAADSFYEWQNRYFKEEAKFDRYEQRRIE